MIHSAETQGSLPPTRGCLIYDRDCRLCVSMKNRLSQAAQERDIRFVPYDSDEARSLLGSTHLPGRPGFAYLIDEAGTTHQGLDAFIPLLPGLRWGRWVLPIWRFSFVRSCAYTVYRWVAKYRYSWFGPSTSESKGSSSGSGRDVS